MPARTPRPEGHRTAAWLGAAAAIGLSLGLLLVSVGGGGPPPRLAQRRAPSVGAAERHAAEEGWFDLELPEGGLRRVRTADALASLLALKEEVDREPVDARLDLDRQAIIPERAGRRLDIDRNLAAIARAGEVGAERAPLAFSPVLPRRVARELDGIAFDVVLAAFETSYDRKRRDREHDLKLLAEAVDGHVLLPGESFAFNAVVGPRDETHGYGAAAAAERGERVDGVGSSASQCASTLHAAATFAALDVLERHPHPGPKPLIELGLEAAVAFPSLDLRLRNPYDFPVVLRETVRDGRVRAEIRGRRRPHAITLLRKVETATPFAQLERPASSLPLGERALAQRGVPGLRLRWHSIRRDGAHAIRHTWSESYPPTPQVILVGTGGAGTAAGRPQQEPASEYLPNELLVMTQAEGGDGTPLIQRVPGRFGTAGWTKNVGAPTWILPAAVGADATPAPDAAKFFGD